MTNIGLFRELIFEAMLKYIEFTQLLILNIVFENSYYHFYLNLACLVFVVCSNTFGVLFCEF